MHPVLELVLVKLMVKTSSTYFFQHFSLLHKLFCRNWLIDSVRSEHVPPQALPALVDPLLDACPGVVVAEELLVDILRVVRLKASLRQKLCLPGGKNVYDIRTSDLELLHVSSWV